jgi:hypothetical protein
MQKKASMNNQNFIFKATLYQIPKSYSYQPVQGK